jgi:hypothetical protein
MEVSGQPHDPAALPPSSHWVGRWVGHRVGLDAVETRQILPCRESNSGRPARSPSLYRLMYPVYSDYEAEMLIALSHFVL